MDPKLLSVVSDDARRLLAPVLEGVEPERYERRRLGMAPDAKYAAFLPEPVAVVRIGGEHPRLK
jgi:hypothetical protein